MIKTKKAISTDKQNYATIGDIRYNIRNALSKHIIVYIKLHKWVTIYLQYQSKQHSKDINR